MINFKVYFLHHHSQHLRPLKYTLESHFSALHYMRFCLLKYWCWCSAVLTDLLCILRPRKVLTLKGALGAQQRLLLRRTLNTLYCIHFKMKRLLQKSKKIWKDFFNTFGSDIGVCTGILEVAKGIVQAFSGGPYRMLSPTFGFAQIAIGPPALWCTFFPDRFEQIRKIKCFDDTYKGSSIY